jgi:hypothetical protein
MIPEVQMGLWIVWRGTSWYGVGKVVGLERCLRYGVGWKVSHLLKVMLESAKDQL